MALHQKLAPYKLEEVETGALDLVSVTGELLNQYKCPLGCEGGFVEGRILRFYFSWFVLKINYL